MRLSSQKINQIKEVLRRAEKPLTYSQIQYALEVSGIIIYASYSYDILQKLVTTNQAIKVPRQEATYSLMYND